MCYFGGDLDRAGCATYFGGDCGGRVLGQIEVIFVVAEPLCGVGTPSGGLIALLRAV